MNHFRALALAAFLAPLTVFSQVYQAPSVVLKDGDVVNGFARYSLKPFKQVEKYVGGNHGQALGILQSSDTPGEIALHDPLAANPWSTLVTPAMVGAAVPSFANCGFQLPASPLCGMKSTGFVFRASTSTGLEGIFTLANFAVQLVIKKGDPFDGSTVSETRVLTSNEANQHVYSVKLTNGKFCLVSNLNVLVRTGSTLPDGGTLTPQHIQGIIDKAKNKVVFAATTANGSGIYSLNLTTGVMETEVASGQLLAPGLNSVSPLVLYARDGKIVFQTSLSPSNQQGVFEKEGADFKTIFIPGTTQYPGQTLAISAIASPNGLPSVAVSPNGLWKAAIVTLNNNTREIWTYAKNDLFSTPIFRGPLQGKTYVDPATGEKIFFSIILDIQIDNSGGLSIYGGLGPQPALVTIYKAQPQLL